MAQPYDERRDSQRVPFRFQVREKAVGGSFVEREGNLALGGIYYAGLHPPLGAVVEVRFLLPGHSEEIMALGEVLRVSKEGERFGAHMRFTDIPVEWELAVARFLQAADPT
jgi:PilZ domain